MKKHLFSVIAMTLALCLLLCSCGGESKEEVSGNLTPVETAAPTETAAPAEEKSVSMGLLEGGTYENSYAGFGFTLDESWILYPAEQIQTLPENIREMFQGTELENYEYTQFTDVLAENPDTLTTMNVLYQQIKLQERLAYAVMSEEALIDATLAQSETMVQAYANAGIAVESMEKKTVTFLGQEHVALYTVAAVQDIPYYILQIYNYHLGDYGIILTVGSYVEDNTESLLELYYSVE